MKHKATPTAQTEPQKRQRTPEAFISVARRLLDVWEPYTLDEADSENPKTRAARIARKTWSGVKTLEALLRWQVKAGLPLAWRRAARDVIEDFWEMRKELITADETTRPKRCLPLLARVAARIRELEDVPDLVDWEDAAAAIVRRDPNIKGQDVAKMVGVHPSQVSRSVIVRRARQETRGVLKKGSMNRSRDGGRRIDGVSAAPECG